MYQNRGNREYGHGRSDYTNEGFDETKIRNIKSRIESGDYSVINHEVVAKLDKRKVTSSMLRNIYHIVLSYHKEKNEVKAKNIALARIIYLVMKNSEYKDFVKLIEAIFSINDADKIKDSFEAMVCYSKLHLK